MRIEWDRPVQRELASDIKARLQTMPSSATLERVAETVATMGLQVYVGGHHVSVHLNSGHRFYGRRIARIMV